MFFTTLLRFSLLSELNPAHLHVSQVGVTSALVDSLSPHVPA